VGRNLVAIDGSKHSPKVVDFAAQLAKSVHVSLVLVNVTLEMPVPEGYGEYAKEEDASRAILQKMTDRLKGVEFETISEVGNPADLILSVARSKNAVGEVLDIKAKGRVKVVVDA
jgi:nucleotide-binding universal stress UspA family protein